MKKVFCLVSLAFLLQTGRICAQQPAFSVVEVYPDTDTLDLALGDSVVSYTIRVANLGNAPFVGFMQILGQYNAGYIYPWNWSNFNPINASDTVTFTWDELVTASPYRYGGGDNTILVWPVTGGGTQALILDSATTHLFIKNLPPDPNGRIPATPDDRVKVYPNPATDAIYFKWLTNQQQLEHVRLYNLQGQEIFQSHDNVNEVNINHLPAGLYLLEVNYRDGIIGRYRIRKE